MSLAELEYSPSSTPESTLVQADRTARPRFRASKSLLLGLIAFLTLASHIALLASLKLVHTHPLWAVGLSPNNLVLWECRHANLVWMVLLAVLSMSVASPIHYTLGVRSLEPRTHRVSRSKMAWDWLMRQKGVQALLSRLGQQRIILTFLLWLWWCRHITEGIQPFKRWLRQHRDLIMAHEHFRLWGFLLVLASPNTGMLVLAGTYKLPKAQVALASLIGRIVRVVGVLYFYYGPLVAQVTGWIIFPLAISIPAMPAVAKRITNRLHRLPSYVHSAEPISAPVPGAAL